MNGEFPKDWKVEKLGEVCEIIMGQSPPSETYNTEGIGLPFFQGKAEFTKLHPIAEKWCSKPNKIAESNDILLSVRAPVGTTNIADRKCCIGRGLAAIRYKNFKYIFYFLRSIEKELDEKGTGTTFKAISGETIRQTELPLPPLSEQHRIVAKIEELFSDLDKGIENLKIAQQQLKTYRQAVLKYAFEGRFTNKKVKDGELPGGWKWVKLGDIFDGTPQNGIYKPASEYGTGINIIRIDGFYDGNIVSNYEYKKLRLTTAEREKYKLAVNDLLINRVNSLPYLGKCGLVKSLKETTVFESNIMRIKLNRKMVNPSFVSRFLSTHKGLAALRKNAKNAVNQASINQTDVSEVCVPLPLIDEQKQIIEEIESRLSVCDKLEETITASLRQSESLRQSILKKAFEGKIGVNQK